MTLLFIDGFDHYTSDAHALGKGWLNFAMYAGISSAYARFSGNGVQISYSNNGYIRKDIGVNKVTIFFGVAIKKNEVGTPGYAVGDDALIEVLDESSVVQVRIWANSNYGFSAYRGDNTLLGSTASTNLFSDGKWFYLEGKITISDTVGVVELQVNETQVLNLTSQNTKNGSDYIRYIDFSSIYNDIGTFFDDIYIDDSQFHGDCRVKTFMPDLDGNSSDFTRSAGSNDYECVDENPPNDDTDYISSNTLNHKSIFGITTGSLGTVKGIQVNNNCRVDEAGVRKIKAIARSNATDYQGAESGEITADYIFEQEIWELDPDDSGAWTQTKLEAAEFGLEITT